MTKYNAKHAYQITQGGRAIIIGKVLLTERGAIFYREEPHDRAVMRKMTAFSIDERALAQWEADGVQTIHFADKDGVYLWAITREAYLQNGQRSDNGAGMQVYVDIDHFRASPKFYEVGWTKQVKLLGSSSKPWVPIAEPKAPEPKPVAPSPQGGLGL